MSIKIDWPAQPVLPDTLSLYWSTTAFTQDTLPTNKIVLDPGAVTYTDTTVPDRTTRYYMVEAIKAGSNPQYSQCLLFGNFSKTGPGNNTVLRGNWNAGYMGFIPAAQFFTVTQLRAAVGAAALGPSPGDVAVTGWYKFVYKGNILFIPNGALSQTGAITWSQIYNLGLAYGVDGPGAAPFDLTKAGFSPAITALVNQKKVVTVGADSFLVRLPKNSTAPTSQDLTDKTTCRGSEWWELMCSMTTSILAADAPYIQTLKWGDPAGIPYPLMATQHFSGASTFSVSNANWSDIFPRSISGAAGGSWISWVPVLEYIPA